jgi:uncharacterized RDD family membrane protein YckC
MQRPMLKGAGVGRRALAVIVDLLIMSPVLFVIGRAFGHTSVVMTSGGPMYRYNMDLSGVFFSTLVIVVYYTVLEGLFGWSVGKLVTGLVVVYEDGSPIDIQAALVRNLIRVIDGLFFYLVAAIAVWATPTNQRFGDKAAHTLVVHWASQPAVMPAPPPPPRADAWTPTGSEAPNVPQP